MTYPVKWYDSRMQGAPVLTGQVNKVIPILDACLINGFGTLTLDSLVVSGGIATGAKSTGHTYLQHSVIEIAGAAPSGLNGEKRVLSVTATTFTFDATGISDQTATGTITAKVPGMGWTKLYSGTNKAVYQRSDLAATAMVLRVDDAYTTYFLSQMFESMSDVDTGVGPAPLTNILYTGKSTSADATARAWRLFCDGRRLYLFTSNNNAWGCGLGFGDLVAYKAGDAFSCFISGGQSNNQAFFLTDVNGNMDNFWLSRSHTQMGALVNAARWSHKRNTWVGYSGMASVPNPVDNRMHAWPIDVWETNAWARGLLAGLFSPLHNGALGDGIILPNEDITGRTYFLQNSFDANRYFAIDLFGPWG